MPGTFLPLVLLPSICFAEFPFALTLDGQYISKTLVLIAVALVIGGTVRDCGGVTSRPHSGPYEITPRPPHPHPCAR